MLKTENLLLGFEHYLIIIFCFEELIFTLIRQMKQVNFLGIIPILFKEQGYLTLLNF